MGSTASVERTSSLRRLALFIPSSFFSSTSVATTVAPSAAKASAMARPIPWPAAVTSANLRCRRPDMDSFLHIVKSVIVAWHAFLRDALVFHRRLEHHAIGKLVDHPALDLLPGRLTGRIFLAALVERDAALGQLGVGNQYICSTLVEIDAHAGPGLEKGGPAAHDRLR